MFRRHICHCVQQHSGTRSLVTLDIYFPFLWLFKSSLSGLDSAEQLLARFWVSWAALVSKGPLAWCALLFAYQPLQLLQDALHSSLDLSAHKCSTPGPISWAVEVKLLWCLRIRLQTQGVSESAFWWVKIAGCEVAPRFGDTSTDLLVAYLVQCVCPNVFVLFLIF